MKRWIKINVKWRISLSYSGVSNANVVKGIEYLERSFILVLFSIQPNTFTGIQTTAPFFHILRKPFRPNYQLSLTASFRSFPQYLKVSIGIINYLEIGNCGLLTNPYLPFIITLSHSSLCNFCSIIKWPNNQWFILLPLFIIILQFEVI